MATNEPQTARFDPSPQTIFAPKPLKMRTLRLSQKLLQILLARIGVPRMLLITQPQLTSNLRTAYPMNSSPSLEDATLAELVALLGGTICNR